MYGIAATQFHNPKGRYSIQLAVVEPLLFARYDHRLQIKGVLLGGTGTVPIGDKHLSRL